MGRNIVVKYWKCLALTLVFWFMSYRCIPAGFYDLGGDSAQYIILAESVSKGLGLKLVNYPGEPLSFYFPPVLCFLLAPVIYLFGRNFYLMHLVVASLGFFSLYFFYRLFKRYSDTLTATVCVFFLATNWAFISFSVQSILSDIPYLFFSGLTLLASGRYIREKTYFNPSAALLLIGLIISYFTRYSGIVLFLAVLTPLFLIRQENRYKKIGLIGGVFLAVFAVWNILELLAARHLISHTQCFFLIDPYAPDKGTVFAHPFALVTRFIGGVNRVFALLADASFFYFVKKVPLLNDLLCGFVLVFVIAGFWIKFREDRSCAFHWYFLCYLALLFMWLFRDFSEGIRYLLPVIPFLLFYFLTGFLKALRFLAARLYPFLLAVFICIFFAFNILNLAAIPESGRINIDSFPPAFKNFVFLHDWININLSGEEVILSRKPPITFLYTNHKSVGYPFTSDIEKIRQEILRSGVSYIIVDEFSKETRDFLLPFLHRYNDKLKLLCRIGDTGLLRVEHLDPI